MRKLLVGVVCAAALAVPSVSPAQQQDGWSYAYVEGVATATQRDNRGRTTATLTCRPPTGDIVLTDYTLASVRRTRGATQAQVRIGAMAVNVPMTFEGRGRNRTVVINLPQRPPILAAVQPNDRLSVTVNNETVTYLEGGPARMREVAYACWGS
jgi:opacity protein-like surface antigen